MISRMHVVYSSCIISADDTTLTANFNDFYAKKDSEIDINLLNDELEKNKLPVTCIS